MCVELLSILATLPIHVHTTATLFRLRAPCIPAPETVMATVHCTVKNYVKPIVILML